MLREKETDDVKNQSTRGSNLSDIFGAIFPISPESVRPLFDQKKNAFVKFTKFLKLQRGSKIVFYTSKKLVGEGIIESVERMEPEIAWSRYEQQIFLNKNQYNEYAARSPISGEDRRMTQITIFFLKSLKRYKNQIRCIYTVTPSGRYITREEYQRIRKN